jgi:uncharacterized membrane protein
MKALTNDLNRIVAIYAISSPLGKAMGVKQASNQIIRSDLLNDLLALMFYHEVVQRQGFTKVFQEQLVKLNISEAMAEDLLKTVVLLLASSVLNGTFKFNVLMYTIIAVCIYHMLIRPLIINTKFSKTIDLAAVEDLAETIVLLSLDTGDIKDMTAKLSGLMVYHHLMKLQ